MSPLTKSDARAAAKINLTLHVTGQRADGYHLLDSLVVFAEDVADRLWFETADRLSLSVTGPMSHGVPRDARNLVWRAAEAVGYRGHITLEKNLPHGAGIGGGSADAAALLRAVTGADEQFAPSQAMRAHALSLGADVLACVVSAPLRMRGIGEIIDPLPPLPAFDLVLVNPGVEARTSAVFEALECKANGPMRQDIPQFSDHSAADADLPAFCDWLGNQRNDLEAPACILFPQINEALDALSDALIARMSGSGSTCFGIYGDGRSAAERIRRDHPNWWVVSSKAAS
ncbi:MAG: 4-(cytidine 5'-diphospho)-2-C-methyl-D-erythritol kinase [Pseudomonadota bacterium]